MGAEGGGGLYTVLYGTVGPIHAHVYPGPLHRSNRAAMLIFNDFIVFYFSVRAVLAKTTPTDMTHMPLWLRVFLRTVMLAYVYWKTSQLFTRNNSNMLYLNNEAILFHQTRYNAGLKYKGTRSIMISSFDQYIEGIS